MTIGPFAFMTSSWFVYGDADVRTSDFILQARPDTSSCVRAS
jgi:hypothetical protein